MRGLTPKSGEEGSQKRGILEIDESWRESSELLSSHYMTLKMSLSEVWCQRVDFGSQAKA